MGRTLRVLMIWAAVWGLFGGGVAEGRGRGKKPATAVKVPRSKPPVYKAPKKAKHPKYRRPKEKRESQMKRDPKMRRAFQQSHPCPSTGKTTGKCPGYVVDHIRPLKRGGPDVPENMQWQTKEAAKAKDRIE